MTGPVPVLIHAYGGFELAQTPSYLVHEPYRSGPLALFWVSRAMPMSSPTSAAAANMGRGGTMPCCARTGRRPMTTSTPSPRT